jgi:site-specific recombinase XerD
MKLSQAIEEFRLDIPVESTRRVYMYTLNKLLKFLGDVELTAIDIAALRRWREVVGGEDPVTKKKLSAHTFHRDVRQCRTFFNWCVDEQLLPYSPASRLKMPKLPKGEPPKAISEIDLERIINQARVYGSARDYAVVRFLAESGGRVGGMLGLRLGDLYLPPDPGVGGQALVKEKGDKTRTVRFGPETVRALRAWLVIRPRDKWGEVVFVGKRGPLTVWGVRRLLERLAKAAGVEGRFNPHAFRHAFARRLLKNGADLGTVSRLMGHADIKTTHQFYAVWTPDELSERYQEFGGVLK